MSGLEPWVGVRQATWRVPALRWPYAVTVRLPHVALVAVSIIAAGVTVRAAGYLSNWSLFIDDARLGINIGWHSLADLTRPLAFEQTAPVPLLWADRVITRVAGMSEYALRALPFVAGVLLLPALWVVARRLLGAREALIAVLLAAASPLLIQYAGYSAKPYGIDAFVTVLLIGVAGSSLATRGDTPARRAVVIAAGAGALWLSQPAAFVVGGVGVALLIRRGARAWVGGAVAAWLLVFGALYVTSYHPVAGNAYLGWFWQGGFIRPGAPGWKWHAARAVLETWSGVPLVPGGRATHALLLIVAVILVGGLAALWHRAGPATATAIGLPYVLLIGASCAGLYPLAGRVDLFVTPLLILILAAAAVALVDHMPVRRRGQAHAALVVAVLLAGAHSARDWFARVQPAYEPTRDLARVVTAAPPEEPVYVYAAALPAWIYYSTDWRAPDTARLRWLAAVAGASGPAFENAQSRPRLLGHDADSLMYVERGRTTVIGIGSGVAYDYYADAPRAAAPDPGWSDAEMRRLRAASHPAGWLLASHYGSRAPAIAGTEIGALLSAARALGGVVTCATVLPTTSLFRIEFVATGVRDRAGAAIPGCRESGADAPWTASTATASGGERQGQTTRVGHLPPFSVRCRKRLSDSDVPGPLTIALITSSR